MPLAQSTFRKSSCTTLMDVEKLAKGSGNFMSSPQLTEVTTWMVDQMIFACPGSTIRMAPTRGSSKSCFMPKILLIFLGVGMRPPDLMRAATRNT